MNILKLLFAGAVNMIASCGLAYLEYYSGGFLDGPFTVVRKVLELPAVLVLSLYQGHAKTLHGTGEKTYFFVSLVLYSLMIAAVQFWWHRKQRKDSSRAGRT